jgi:hypothetical protein
MVAYIVVGTVLVVLVFVLALCAIWKKVGFRAGATFAKWFSVHIEVDRQDKEGGKDKP